MAGSTAKAGAARPAGAGIDFPRGWLHLEGALACSSFKHHALFEQVIVEGALCSKAAASSWSKPVALLERGRERRLRPGPREERSLLAA